MESLLRTPSIPRARSEDVGLVLCSLPLGKRSLHQAGDEFGGVAYTSSLRGGQVSLFRAVSARGGSK